MVVTRILRPLERRTVRWADAFVQFGGRARRRDRIERRTAGRGGGDPQRRGRAGRRGADPRRRSRISPSATSSRTRGHDLLLEAFARALDATVSTLGSASPARAGRRRCDRAPSGSPSRTASFLGSSSDVGALLDDCAFSVLASRSEGLPNAILEASRTAGPWWRRRSARVPEALADGGHPRPARRRRGAHRGAVEPARGSRAVPRDGRRGRRRTSRGSASNTWCGRPKSCAVTTLWRKGSSCPSETCFRGNRR
jgi:hypothetical protein